MMREMSIDDPVDELIDTIEEPPTANEPPQESDSAFGPVLLAVAVLWILIRGAIGVLADLAWLAGRVL